MVTGYNPTHAFLLPCECWPAHLEARRREPGEQPVQVALRAQSRWEKVIITMCYSIIKISYDYFKT